MEVSVLSIPEGLSHWHLVASYLRMRKDIFIGKLEWPLHQVDSMEFEQYDRVDTVYVVAHEGSKVFGGARLLRTDRTVGVYSYMIRDAFECKLPGLPNAICSTPPPYSERVWELTRFTATGTKDVGQNILKTVNDYLASQKALSCLFLGPPAFLRMAKSMNFNPVALGPIARNCDGSFLAFSCDILS